MDFIAFLIHKSVTFSFHLLTLVVNSSAHLAPRTKTRQQMKHTYLLLPAFALLFVSCGHNTQMEIGERHQNEIRGEGGL